jgi:hypothetical protein
MAIEKNIVIGADLSGLETKLGELIDLLKTSQEQANKTSDQLNEINEKVDNIGKNSKSSTKSVGGLAKGFKGMGVAIKAAGIGILLGAMGILKDLFDNNQKVVDVFSTSFNVLAGVFSEVSKVIEDVYNNVSKSSENFDALGKVMSGIITVALTPMKLSFYAIKLALQSAQLAWEKSFLGGKDPEKIEELKAGIAETKASIQEVADAAIEAGGDIVSNIGEAVTEVGAIGTQVLDGFKDIDMKGILTNAKAMTELNKAAELAEARAQGLIEKYDLQAEKLRQVRDDERLSMNERIKANEDLGKVLEEQEKVMLKNAKITLAKANQELALAPDNIEFIKAKMAAENELAGVQAQVAGFRSEQLMNEMALQREMLDIENARSETEQEINELQSQVAIEQATTMRKRLDLEEELSKKSFELENQRLMNQLNTMEIGSTMYEETINALDLLDAERFQTQQEEARKRIALEQAVQDSKVQMSQDAIGALNGLIQSFAGENEKAQKRAFMVNKAAGIANAVISTSQAVAKALAETTDPTPTQSLRFANAALAAATGTAQVATIARQQFNGGGDVDTNIPQGGTAPSTAPQFNIVGASGQNAILESLQRNPVKAYVVGSDVTSQQELDRNRINQVSFP